MSEEAWASAEVGRLHGEWYIDTLVSVESHDCIACQSMRIQSVEHSADIEIHPAHSSIICKAVALAVAFIHWCVRILEVEARDSNWWH